MIPAPSAAQITGKDYKSRLARGFCRAWVKGFQKVDVRDLNIVVECSNCSKIY